MGLNDPFGRHSRREESNYRSLRDSLKSAGVDDPAAAERCLNGITRNGLVFGGIVCAAAVTAALLFPASSGVAFTLAAVALLWLLSTTFRGRRYVRRYIAEELAPNQKDSSLPRKSL